MRAHIDFAQMAMLVGGAFTGRPLAFVDDAIHLAVIPLFVDDIRAPLGCFRHFRVIKCEFRIDIAEG